MKGKTFCMVCGEPAPCTTHMFTWAPPRTTTPVAWMREDGHTISDEVKRALTKVSGRKAEEYSVPLSPPDDVCAACAFKDSTNAALQAQIVGEASLRADAERLRGLASMGAATAFGQYIAQCITADGWFCEYHTPPKVGEAAIVHGSRLGALRAAIDAALRCDAKRLGGEPNAQGERGKVVCAEMNATDGQNL